MKQIVAWDRRQVWAGVLGSLSCPLLTSVAEYILTGGVSGWKPVVAAVVGAVAGLLVARMVIGKPAPQTPEPSESRVLSPRSPSELVALTRGKTEIAAKDATRPHIGTWLQFQGRVVDVGEADQDHEKVMQVILEDLSFGFSRMYSHFDSPWRKRIEILAIGDQVTVTGEISSILPHVIFLKKCEMV